MKKEQLIKQISAYRNPIRSRHRRYSIVVTYRNGYKFFETDEDYVYDEVQDPYSMTHVELLCLVRQIRANGTYIPTLPLYF